MIRLSPRVKMHYFDRSIIRKNWSKINETPLKRAGLLVRKIARGSIRKANKKKSVSSPGSPPLYHTPTKEFKMIFSEPGKTSVVVGMVGFNSQGVPGRHEHGATGTIQGIDDSVAAIRTFRRTGRRLRRPMKIRWQERPFMRPALIKALPTLPKIWSTSVGGA